MTLYHYVANKDELVTLMMNAVMGEVLVPDDELPQEWRPAITRIAIATPSHCALRKLLKRSEERKLFDLTAVHEVLDRNRGHRGHRPLCRALALYEPPPFTRSDFEHRFYEAVLSAGLPTPRVNFNVAGMELDLYWPSHRFAVELDLFETHGTRESFEEDRIRREALLL